MLRHIKTNKGSEVMRMFGKVGKAIGGHVYLHKNYATDVMSPDIWEMAQEICEEADPDLFNSYNCIRYTFNKCRNPNKVIYPKAKSQVR